VGAPLAVLAGVAIIVPATASSGMTSTAASTRTFSLTEVETSSTFDDLNTPSFSQGDLFIFTSDLRSGSVSVGSGNAACTVMVAKTQRVQCEETFTLPEGQITTQSAVNFGKPSLALAVTGGTGSYKDVRGVVLVESIPGTTKSHDTFELSG
jgi:hypothetical protein